MTLFIKYRTAIFLLFFCCGIFIKTFLSNSHTSFLFLLIPALILTIKYPRFYFILFLPLGFLLTPNYSANKVLEAYSGKKISATGTLIRNPEQRENSIRLFLKLKSINPGTGEIKTGSKIVAYLETVDSDLTYGDSIYLKNIKLKKIKNFKNPGSFNIEQFYNRKNIFYTTYVESKNLKDLGRDTDVNQFLYRINLLRTEFGRFAASNSKYPESTVINALTIGDKSNIPGQIREIFSGLGIAHIFAISGLHVGAIAIGFYFLIKWLLKRSEYILLTFQMPRIAAILTILPVFIYTALAGFSISSVRAFIMVTIYLLSIALGKDDSKLNTLFTAALIILLLNPNSLFELSFQLSFLSVFGILMVHSFYKLEISTGFDKIKTALTTTIAATLITLPLVINTFGYIPLFSVPANLILIPFVEFIIVPLGLLSLITFKISSSLSILVLNIDTRFISILLEITDWMDKQGLATITAPGIDFTTTFFLMFTAGLFLLGKHYRKLNYLLPLSLLLLIIFGAKNFYGHANGGLEINILDSGSKHIALIKTDSSETILINGGYSRKSKSDFIERSVVIPYLLHNNITSIDHLVLASLDRSHINGAAAILKKIDVNNIWINGHKLSSELWEQIYEKNINLNKISNEKNFLQTGSLSLTFLRQGKHSVYDSKFPEPLLIEMGYNNYIFHMGEGTEYGLFNNKKSSLLYITEDSAINSDIIIENFSPENIVCRKCKNNFSGISENIYETDLNGTFTVTVRDNKIKFREYTKQ